MNRWSIGSEAQGSEARTRCPVARPTVTAKRLIILQLLRTIQTYDAMRIIDQQVEMLQNGFFEDPLRDSAGLTLAAGIVLEALLERDTKHEGDFERSLKRR